MGREYKVMKCWSPIPITEDKRAAHKRRGHYITNVRYQSDGSCHYDLVINRLIFGNLILSEW